MSFYYTADFVGATGLHSITEFVINTSNDLIIYVNNTSNILSSNINNTSNDLIRYVNNTSNDITSNIDNTSNDLIRYVNNTSNDITSNIDNTSNELAVVFEYINKTHDYNGFFTSELTNSIHFGTDVNGNGDHRTIIDTNGEIMIWKEYNLNPLYQAESWNTGGIALPGVERGGYWKIKDKIEDIYINLFNKKITIDEMWADIELLNPAVAGVVGQLAFAEGVLVAEGLGGLSVSAIIIKLVKEKIDKTEAYEVISSSNIDSSNYTDAKISGLNDVLLTTISSSNTDTSNYIFHTSNVISDRITGLNTDTSNYVLNTSNNIINIISGLHNIPLTTIGGVSSSSNTNTSNYILNTSNNISTIITNLSQFLNTQWTSLNGSVYNLNSNIGLGTISPEHKLDVVGTTQSDDLTIKNKIGVGTAIPTYELDVIGTIQGDELIIKNNVGIGTPTPTYELDVIGTIQGNDLTIKNNIGIGTTIPIYELDVKGTSKTDNLIVSTDTKTSIDYFINKLVFACWIPDEYGIKNYSYNQPFLKYGMYYPSSGIETFLEGDKYVCKYYNSTDTGKLRAYDGVDGFVSFTIGVSVKLDTRFLINENEVPEQLIYKVYNSTLSYTPYNLALKPINNNTQVLIKIYYTAFDNSITWKTLILDINPLQEHFWMFHLHIGYFAVFCDGIKLTTAFSSFELNPLAGTLVRSILIGGNITNTYDTIMTYSNIIVMGIYTNPSPSTFITDPIGTMNAVKTISSIPITKTRLYGKTYIENLDFSFMTKGNKVITLYTGNTRPV